MPTAMITGVNGQDGSYLAELLLEKGYEVVGCMRRSSKPDLSNLAAVVDDIEINSIDLADQSSLFRVVGACKPDEIYNLGAQSFVAASFDQPEYTGDVSGLGAARLLEAVRQLDPSIRIYQASSSEMYGRVAEVPQNELTPFYPRSPYAAAKAYAHYLTVNYREAYGIHASAGILFNHESPRRGVEFVTRKITLAVAAIKLGLQHELHLGNLDAQRDWGHAKDYVEAMWMMLQQDVPDDYVIATGETHSVRHFVELAFGHVGLDWQNHVVIDERLFRPSEVDRLLGDPTKAKAALGWEPRVGLGELVAMMVDSDLALLS